MMRLYRFRFSALERVSGQRARAVIEENGRVVFDSSAILCYLRSITHRRSTQATRRRALRWTSDRLVQPRLQAPTERARGRAADGAP
jgi:glutathione S-transferase